MRLANAIFFILFFVSTVQAQHLINVRAGLITLAEGPVFLEEKPFQFKSEDLKALQREQRLQTTAGRVEVQLGPGTSLWMGANGSIRMINPVLENTVIQIEDGEIFIEIAEKYKNNSLSILSGSSSVEIKEPGQYRFTSNPHQLQVFKGKAKVRQNNKKHTVKKGKAADLDNLFEIYKFQESRHDPLLQWAARRSRIVHGPILLAQRMEATRQRTNNQRYWFEMQRMQQMQIQRMQQELQMQQTQIQRMQQMQQQQSYQ